MVTANSADSKNLCLWLMQTKPFKVITSISLGEAISPPFWKTPHVIRFEYSDRSIDLSLELVVDESGIRTKRYVPQIPETVRPPLARNADAAAHILTEHKINWPLSGNGGHRFYNGQFKNHKGIALVSTGGDIIAVCARQGISALKSHVLVLKKTIQDSPKRESWSITQLFEDSYPTMVLAGSYVAIYRNRNGLKTSVIYNASAGKQIDEFPADAIDMTF